MTKREPDADETIVIRRAGTAAPPVKPRRHLLVPGAVGGVVLLLMLVLGLAVWWPRPAPQRHAALAPPLTAPHPPPPSAAPEFVVRTATQAQILDHVDSGLTIFRFVPDPHILVLDFGSLYQQGMMLDRIAALTEKAKLPHNRVLTDAELDAAIHAGGDTIGTYYYGHDYSVQELVRFFRLAAADHVTLHPQEAALRRLMQQLGWFQPGVHAALISIPQVNPKTYVTLAARSAILQHELSHGLYYSDPAYAAYVRQFWQSELTAAERAAFIRFLGSEEYDTSITDLMINECQAYLMFTRDPAFFRPSLIGMTPQRLTQLQTEFAAGMPNSWLRDTLLALNAGEPVAAAMHPPGAAGRRHGPD